MQVTQYDDDFYIAVSTAWDHFDSYPLDENATQIIVFDIDETSLSNEKPRIGEAPERSMSLLRPGQQLSGVATSYAPALQPLLELYTELWERGFSVTFITGRWRVLFPYLACSCCRPRSSCFKSRPATRAIMAAEGAGSLQTQG